jgi:hypothetical protein
MSQFHIHSICVVKNEADIIGHCLEEALKWCDFVYVYDGDSDDGTWETVLRMQDQRIIPWKRDGKVFRESLRAEVFNEFRERSRPGDWWCHLDADEFYAQDPRQFLRTVQAPVHVVWSIMIEYYLTVNDVAEIDFAAPVKEILPKLKSYEVTNSEPRFFRYRRGLRWPLSATWPLHMGLSHPDRLLLKHYKYRSPAQISRRLATRQQNINRGFRGWMNSRTIDWREKIWNAAELHEDRGDGSYLIDSARLPDHRGSRPRRWIQRAMHGLGIWP